MKAFIFSAGLGTRLKPLTNSCPKALIAVNKKTLLERCIRYLQSNGINDVVINVHYFADDIENFVRNNNCFGSNFNISDERNALLETGGGLKKASHYLENEHDFVVINVDILTNLNLSSMIKSHNNSNALCTLAVMDRNSSRKLIFDNDMNLTGWQNSSTGEKKIAKESNSNISFAYSGIAVLSGNVLLDIPFDGKFSLIDLFLYWAKNNIIKGYNHTGDLFVDVGKPENIIKAESMFL